MTSRITASARSGVNDDLADHCFRAVGGERAAGAYHDQFVVLTVERLHGG
jgi:hypothetical protein